MSCWVPVLPKGYQLREKKTACLLLHLGILPEDPRARLTGSVQLIRAGYAEKRLRAQGPDGWEPSFWGSKGKCIRAAFRRIKSKDQKPNSQKAKRSAANGQVAALSCGQNTQQFWRHRTIIHPIYVYGTLLYYAPTVCARQNWGHPKRQFWSPFKRT